LVLNIIRVTYFVTSTTMHDVKSVTYDDVSASSGINSP